MDVKTKRQLRTLIGGAIVVFLALAVYWKRDAILPALGQAAEKTYDAADEFSDGEFGR